MNDILDVTRILAVDPTSRGFGYALLEKPDRLVDWGIVQVMAARNAACLRRIEELTDWYQAHAVVTEDPQGRGCRRCARVRTLLRDVQRLAARKGIPSMSLPW